MFLCHCQNNSHPGGSGPGTMDCCCYVLFIVPWLILAWRLYKAVQPLRSAKHSTAPHSQKPGPTFFRQGTFNPHKGRNRRPFSLLTITMMLLKGTSKVCGFTLTIGSPQTKFSQGKPVHFCWHPNKSGGADLFNVEAYSSILMDLEATASEDMPWQTTSAKRDIFLFQSIIKVNHKLLTPTRMFFT